MRKIIYTSVMFEKVEDIDKIEDNKQKVKMIEFAGKCVAKFIPIPRDERRKEILRILNKIEKYGKRKEDYEKLSKR
ncbi:MAG: hypothetical protein NC917_05170, partial [Candidatus Omnitrophica bacterium]|nr:hypothetical protein [Candidatus Omnitrophota bacterium]